MTTSNQKVTSREYKLMLNTDRFRDRNKGAEEFLNLIGILIRKQDGTVERREKEERRHTSYFDTPELALNQNGFALRLREEADDDFQINLKYRHSDRYISAVQDVSSSQPGKIKFEEDILPPFVSKFSNSNSVKTNVRPQLKTIKDVTSLFPGLSPLGIDPKNPVRIVNNFNPLEIVRDLCKFQFGTTEVDASLSFWYFEDDTNWPLVGEFSFVYKEVKGNDSELEQYSLEVVKGTKGFFNAIQNQTGWLDFKGTTKTAFALEVL